MGKLTDEYGIEVDPRYRVCVREAAYCLLIFLAAAVAGVGSMYGLTAGRSPHEYSRVLGLPSYLFWGIIVTDLAFLVLLLAGQRFLFRDLPLDSAVPGASSSQGQTNTPAPNSASPQAVPEGKSGPPEP